MVMPTVLKIGPADHGRRMSFDEYMAGDYQEGYQYEIIDGRLYVSPLAAAPMGLVERWIYLKLQYYSERYPEILNFVYSKCRVFVPGRRGITAPEPDVAAYRDFPLNLPFRKIRWQDVSPVLVVEVLSLDDPDKDLVRNVELYLQVRTIREYWLFDPRPDPEQPSLRVFRRHGKNWRVADFAFGETYTTKLLPAFKLIINPRR
jgi:Uma2 family endonuclease